MTVGPGIAMAPPMVGAYLVERLEAQGARLLETGPRVLGSATDDEAVHDVRVALRRIRTVLELGRSVLGRFHADEVRRALRELMQATGGLRDEEVFLKLLSSLAVDQPEVAAWIETRRRRERRLRNAVARAIRSGQLERGQALLAALLAFRVNPSKDRRLAKFARRAVDRARRDVDRRRSARLDDPEALHRLRIAYKRLRYTVDTFSDALPPELAALAQPAARFQGRLGDLHDVDVALGCVRRARALSDPTRQALLAALALEREARITAYRREVGIVTVAPLVQAVGGDSLRKISSR
jgi:CHAD domain-containing protein